MADAPLPLNVATEFVGEWFTPDRPDEPAPGRLQFDPVEGLSLETVSAVPVMGGGEIPLMLGRTVEGRLVTLRDLGQRSQRFNSRGGTLTRFRASAAFVGMHAWTPADLRLWHVDARLSHLNDWCYRTGIDFADAIFPRGGSIAFQPPDPFVVGRARGALLSVRFDFEGERDPDPREREDPYAFNLEQRAWLRITPRRGRWTFDSYMELVTRSRWFFGFAASAQDQLLELRGEASLRWRVANGPVRNTREPVWILFAPQALLEAEPRRASDMLFCRADLAAGSEARPLTRWLQLCDRLEMDPVFGPYFAALPARKMYTDLRFLVFAQAAEAYDARRHPSPKGSTIRFKTRIETLVARMPSELRRMVPAGFAEEVRDTRNFGTHRDARNRQRAATGARLLALSELVKFVFDVAILRELGFSQGETVRLFNRNDRLTGFINLMLGYMAETKPGR
jgi:hypothetical protein